MILIELSLLVILCSAITWGFSVACRFDNYDDFDKLSPEMQRQFPEPTDEDKMIFWWVRYYGGPVLGPYWSKPVYRCTICMASIHSLLPVLFLSPITPLLAWPVVVLATAGLNAFLSFNFNTR